MLGRLAPLFGLVPALVVACARPAPAHDEDASLPQPPDGALVRRVMGECSVVPCPSGRCRVVCPAPDQMLRVDVREPLLGNITVSVDAVTVLSERVTAMPTTGLAASVGVRPLGWPAAVEVRVDDRAARTVVERGRPFVATRAQPGGAIGFAASATGFSYE